MRNLINWILIQRSMEEVHPEQWIADQKAALANLLGSKTKATRILANSSQPTTEELMKISEHLEVPMDDLMKKKGVAA